MRATESKVILERKLDEGGFSIGEDHMASTFKALGDSCTALRGTGEAALSLDDMLASFRAPEASEHAESSGARSSGTRGQDIVPVGEPVAQGLSLNFAQVGVPGDIASVGQRVGSHRVWPGASARRRSGASATPTQHPTPVHAKEAQFQGLRR